MPWCLHGSQSHGTRGGSQAVGAPRGYLLPHAPYEQWSVPVMGTAFPRRSDLCSRWQPKSGSSLSSQCFLNQMMIQLRTVRLSSCGSLAIGAGQRFGHVSPS
mmetsp:Transcript_45065/g.79966  ORF Transcript_45065/g.79966 Transcript_45065/m.79966 type:complete len:102 (+) Transcript_45065:29-334(+)